MPRQNGRYFADDIFRCIYLNKTVWIPIKISLQFVPKGPINNIPALVNIMAGRRPGAKPLSEPIMGSVPPHICVNRPQHRCHVPVAGVMAVPTGGKYMILITAVPSYRKSDVDLKK